MDNWSYHPCTNDCYRILGFIIKAQNGLVDSMSFTSVNIQQLSQSLPVLASSRLKAVLAKWNLEPLAIWENLHLPGVKATVQSSVKPIAGIYAIVNLISGKMYIGSAHAGRMQTRYHKHFYSNSGSLLVRSAVSKYDLSNFAFLVLESFPGFDPQLHNQTLLDLETAYIAQLESVTPKGYNIASIGGNTAGVLHTEASKVKMREIFSDARRQMIGALNRGKVLSTSTVEKIRQNALNRSAMSDKTRELVSLNSAKANLYQISMLDGTALSNGDYLLIIRTIPNVATFCGCDERTVRRALTGNGVIRRKWVIKYIGKANSTNP